MDILFIQADIDFSKSEWPLAFGNGAKFTGKIFGNGHKISNVSFKTTARGYTGNGLFSNLDGAYMENLTFENITHTVDIMDVLNGANFGLLAGSCTDGTSFKNVKLSGKLLFTDNCSAVISKSDIFSIGLVTAVGDITGITYDVNAEKVSSTNSDFNVKVAEDGSVTLTSGIN